MTNFDRRELLRTGLALAPLGSLSLMAANFSRESSQTAKPIDCQETDQSNDKPQQNRREEKKMKVKYMEIVTPEADAMCKMYSAIHGVKFSDPIPTLGNARTTEMSGGGMVGIRAPMRPDEKPVTRSYMHVDDLGKAVAAAKAAGAEIAIESMELPGQGKIAIYIQGGIECGLWQS